MVSQNEITKVLKILDILQTASPFSRIKNNIEEFGLQISLEKYNINSLFGKEWGVDGGLRKLSLLTGFMNFIDFKNI